MAFFDVGGKDWEELALSQDLIHMGHNCNHLPIHPTIKQAMSKAIEAEEFRNYSPPFGFKELRELIYEDVGVPGVEVLVTQGSTDAIYQAMSVLLRPGDETIITDPAWPHIGNFARSLGSTVVEVPVYNNEPGFKLSPNLLREKFSKRTKIISIIDPLNPLGAGYTEEEIRELCNLAQESEAYLLHDCTYRDFADGKHYPSIQYYEKAVMTISLSKSCGFAGLRIGACIAFPEIFEKILNNHISRLGVNWVAQRGAIAAYKSKKEWLPILLETSKYHQKIINECVQSIKGLKCIVYPSKGNFVAVDVTGTGFTAEEIVKRVLDAGIVIRSGEYTSRRFGNRFIRITTTVSSEHVSRFCELFPQIFA